MTQSSPSECPGPNWRPADTARPTEITSVPPPDSVPMMEARLRRRYRRRPPPRRDAALHHRGAQGAGVEVHEPFVHDGGSGRRCAPRRTRSASAMRTLRHHVVDHPGNLSTPYTVTGPRRADAAGPTRILDAAGAVVGPHDVGQRAEHAVEVDCGSDQAVRDQMQPQVGVIGVGGLVGEHRHGADRHDLHTAVGIRRTARPVPRETSSGRCGGAGRAVAPSVQAPETRRPERCRRR